MILIIALGALSLFSGIVARITGVGLFDKMNGISPYMTVATFVIVLIILHNFLKRKK